ncbi:TPA: hypothetical protein DEO28_00245 [Candidatus Dependentiae bacterium]|nr:MAG: hypothetical protein UR14_C0001G0094 [candidate division TM6 bacterium GW2011_GWE2_31_21]KKP54026.1 MAG: hypothetical protein UR43_C0001G0044 [candidate division TM6 bacterium GW2011_GWF2_33_332]HBS48392.1 hypothetical protein [Candidatus Dependentiae bacterium]HBZ72934.1 hypothetical protein [Candidatus Dependentiae bacterium]
MFKKTILALTLLFFFPPNIFAMEGEGSAPQDPLVLINYSNAFDQNEIHEKFRSLIEQLGCAGNVFDQENLEAHSVDLDSISIDIPGAKPVMIGSAAGCEMPADFTATTIRVSGKQAIEMYEQACLKQLNHARFMAMTRRAREAFTSLALLGGAVGLLSCLLPPTSLGGSFGVFAAVFDGIRLLHPITGSALDLANPPINQLNALEDRFAKTQCFIPKVLWPIIIEKFMAARTNLFERRDSAAFIEFALDLATFRPKPTLTLPRDSFHEKFTELFTKIDQFFDGYERPSAENILMLKNNVYKFIHLLLDNKSQTPRYLYLYGTGGIGKTHFANQLRKWIEEFIQGGIHFENMVITPGEELEGCADTPGAFLRILRNQLKENKLGSVVIMDEATWLNNDNMISPAKRVFNGDQSRLSTSYFGRGLEGSGINLKMPPMLIILASNEQIKDPALKKRFDVIEFPSPKKETLILFAQEIAENSKFLQELQIDTSRFNFGEWLDASHINNFNDVKSQIEPAIKAAAQR